MTTGRKCRRCCRRKQQPLGLPRRGEAFHHPFPDPGRLMGVLGPVVEVLPAAIGHRRQKLAVSDLIAGQLVGDNHPRHLSQALEQVGRPEGVSPSGSHRSVREPLDSYGSCHLDHQTVGRRVVHIQWQEPRVLCSDPLPCPLELAASWNRRYFLRTQRIR